MTNAEAAEILKSRRMCAAYVDSEYVDSIDIEAIDMAISALKKQEQKIPLTNADRIRAMTDEELAQYRADILCQLLDELNDKYYIGNRWDNPELLEEGGGEDG